MFDDCAIHNIDALEFLRAQAADTVDLIIADPPYGIEKNFGQADPWKGVNEWAQWCETWLAEVRRVLKVGGNLLLYGIHNFICYNQVSLYKLGMTYQRQFIWHYENGFCGHARLPRATYEPILWFSKGERCYFEEMREPYKSEARLRYKVIKNGRVWSPNPKGRIAGDVWQIPTLAGRRFRDERVDHPTQKPLALSRRLVRHFSPVGGLVIVPFVGSGSECVAAFENGRRFMGAEINIEYCRMAESRLRAAGWKASRVNAQAKIQSGEKLATSPDKRAANQ